MNSKQVFYCFSKPDVSFWETHLRTRRWAPFQTTAQRGEINRLRNANGALIERLIHASGGPSSVYLLSLSQHGRVCVLCRPSLITGTMEIQLRLESSQRVQVYKAQMCVCVWWGGAHVTHSHTKTSKAIPINVHVSGELIRNEAKMT